MRRLRRHDLSDRFKRVTSKGTVYDLIKKAIEVTSEASLGWSPSIELTAREVMAAAQGFAKGLKSAPDTIAAMRQHLLQVKPDATTMAAYIAMGLLAQMIVDFDDGEAGSATDYAYMSVAEALRAIPADNRVTMDRIAGLL